MKNEKRWVARVLGARRTFLWASLFSALLWGPSSLAAQAPHWNESFLRAFFPADGAKHRQVAAYENNAILAGRYAVDLLEYDGEGGWNLAQRTKWQACSQLPPPVAMDEQRVSVAAPLDPRDCDGEWAVYAKYLSQTEEPWSLLLVGVPEKIRDLDTWHGHRAVVGFHNSSGSGAWIYEHDGTSLQKAAEMLPVGKHASTLDSVSIYRDYAAAAVHWGNTFGVVVYKRVKPGHWELWDQRAIDRIPTSVVLYGSWLAVGTLGGGAHVFRQGGSEHFEPYQHLTAPKGAFYGFFGYQVEIDDRGLYLTSLLDDVEGYPGTEHGAVHEYVHSEADNVWVPTVRFVSTLGEHTAHLGVRLALTPRDLLATSQGGPNGTDWGTLVSFVRPFP